MIKDLEYIYELVEEIQTEDRDVEDVLDSIKKIIELNEYRATNPKAYTDIPF
jgi:spore cortex formation protein SpoVR/YcgB (stage V sporulation)